MKFKLVEDTKNIPWNKGLKKERPQWQIIVDDDGKLRQRYKNKCTNAAKEGITCKITFEEYCKLVAEAGLVSSDLGFSSGKKYVLARYNDSGDYEYGNCRFITQKENAQERKVSDKSREASKRNVIKMNNSRPPDMSDRIKQGIANSLSYAERKRKAAERKAKYDAMKDTRYSGEHNSQLGTYWITDGVTNLKWSDKKGEIPKNFRRGRVIK